MKTPLISMVFCWMPAMWGNGRTVRTERWRLVERAVGSRELYDHERDPLEDRNIIADPRHAPLVRRLHGMLEKEFGPLPAGPSGRKRGRL